MGREEGKKKGRGREERGRGREGRGGGKRPYTPTVANSYTVVVYYS